MRGLLNGLLYCLTALVIAYSLFNRPSGEVERRPIPDHPAPAQPAPAVRHHVPPPGLPVTEIEIQARSSAIGTAFAVADGWWLTARHVVDGCDKVGVVMGDKKARRVNQVYVHPSSDLALLHGSLSRPPLILATRGSFSRGQDGYASGYPQDRPGDVHARYLGNVRLRSTGRYRTDEVAAAWAEIERVPDSLPALGGISGGPMLDRDGIVIGVMVASSHRRGRVITVRPATMAAFIEAHRVPVSGRGATPPLAGNRFSSRGQELRRSLRVAQVVCWVRSGSRRPRP